MATQTTTQTPAPLALTDEAKAKLAELRAVTERLGLTPNQVHALLIAEDFAETVSDYRDEWEDLRFISMTEVAAEVLCIMTEDCQEEWREVLAELGSFFTEAF